jgi:ABC-2 type transport system permease protein
VSLKTSPLAQLTLNRLREFVREPAALFWVYGFPILLALGLGLAFRDRPVESIPVDVATDGHAGRAAAEECARQLAADGRLKVTLTTLGEGRNRLRTAKTGLVMVPTAAAPGYEVWADPNRPDSALARAAVDAAMLRAGNPKAVAPAVRESDEPGGRYIDFLLPGLIGTGLMGGGLFGVGFMIVDLRVRKLLKRYVATPMRRRDFLLSLMLSRLLFVVADVAVLLLAGYLLFGVTVRGDWLALAVLVLLGGVAFTGVGLLIASRARTTETVGGLMNLVMLPMYVLSGVFFPVSHFPDAIQPVIQALPLTALINGLRAVINDGASWPALAVPGGVLAAWAVASFALALRLFRWQ